MQLNPFLIDNFHYFDKKLFNQQISTVAVVDWKHLLQVKKTLYPHHYFIVIEGARVLFADCLLLTAIRTRYEHKTMVLELDTDIKQDEINLVIIQLHQQEQSLIIRSSGDYPTSIVHYHVVCQKAHSYMKLEVENCCYYHHLVESLTEQIAHFEINFQIRGSTHAYWLQHQRDNKVKTDIQATLFEDASFCSRSLTHLQEKQLRDDTIEVVHQGQKTQSLIEYLSLNNGKSVSQINSVISDIAYHSETKQDIKHILLGEEAISNSKPNLMIENPEVIAAHGNNIGSFNPENIFYLKQRGLSALEAQKLITQSMLEDFCNKTHYHFAFMHYFYGAHHE